MAKWLIDPMHSSAGFKVQHLGISWVRGEIYGVSGEINYDTQSPESASFEATIDVNTLSTGVAPRDGHLKSPDFFDVEKYPTITFKSTKVANVNGNVSKVEGDLTIHGVTKQVILDVTLNGTSDKVSQSGETETVAAFSITTLINRTDFGLTWNMDIAGGKLLVGNDVKIEVEVEAILQP